MSNVTYHADDRVRKRMGVPRKAVQKIADKALAEGKKHSDFSGSFKRYLDGVFLEHKNASNMRVYHGQLFVFAGETLITAWPVPSKFRGAAQ